VWLNRLLSYSGYFGSRLLFVDRRHPLKLHHFVGKIQMTQGMPMAQAGDVRSLGAALVDLLPPAPARLLVLGDCGEVFLHDLCAQGYEVIAPPFCQPQDYAQTPTTTRRGIYQVDLHLAPAAAASFAAAIVWNFSPQVHPLAMFDQLTYWLAEDAPVHLVGPQMLDLPPIMQHWLDYVVAIGARCGFAEHVFNIDAAAYGNEYFMRSFRKTTTPRWQLRHVRPSDFDEIATLFHEVFGQTLSRDLWSWKYGQGHGNSATVLGRSDW
jgi:hypothetical protein